jgi:acetolactate synthase-1/2/3 large subunit
LTDWLHSQGINHVFAVAGADVASLLESVRADGRIRLVAATNEFVAASMAEGFARRSGRPAAVVVCGGPGEAALLPAALHGGIGSVPVLWVTACPADFHEDVAAPSFCPSREIVKSAGLCAVDACGAAELSAALRKAGAALRSGRPALLRVSDAVQRMEFDPVFCGPEVSEAIQPASMESRGPRTILAVGTGAIPWTGMIRHLSAVRRWPVITEMTSRGVVPEVSDLSLGHLGFLPSPAALAATDSQGLLAADRVVALGVCDEFRRALTSRGAVLQEVGKGAVGTWLERMLALGLDGEADEAWREVLRQCRTHREIHLHGEGLCHALLVREVSAFLGPRAVHVADAGIFHQAVALMVAAGEPRTVLATEGLSLMGWSMGAAQGAAMADPDVPVVAWLGDGSFLMHGLALATAARDKLRVIHVIAENGVLGSPRSRHAVGPEDPALLPAVDLAGVAAACGVAVMKVSDPAELRKALPRLRDAEGPVVLLAAVGTSDPCVRGWATGYAFLDRPRSV